MKTRTLVAAVLCASQAFSPAAQAAEMGVGGVEKVQGPTLTSEFIYRNDTEEALIPVYLLGAVSKPGLYHIPGNMDVLGLLTLAGGTLADAEIDHVLVRGQGNAPKQHLVNFDLNQIVKGGETQRVGLVSNDLVYVTPGKPATPLSSTVLTVIGITVGFLSIIATSIVIGQTRK